MNGLCLSYSLRFSWSNRKMDVESIFWDMTACSMVKIKVKMTTDGQTASLSWCQSPVWGPRPDFLLLSDSWGVCWCGVPSLTRGRVCNLQFPLALTSAVILGSQSCGTYDHILLSQIRDSTNLEGENSVFRSPSDSMAQLYPPAVGSF
jgi:hypothetical protein